MKMDFRQVKKVDIVLLMHSFFIATIISRVLNALFLFVIKLIIIKKNPIEESNMAMTSPKELLQDLNLEPLVPKHVE